jgi:hypothetical protein
MPQLEELTKKKNVTAGTSIGTGEMSIPNWLKRGEEVGVIIVTDSVLTGFHQHQGGWSGVGWELHPAGVFVGWNGRTCWHSDGRYA